MSEHGRRDVRISGSPADWAPCSRAEREDGNLLARVISATPRRIATVICGDDDEIVGCELRLQFLESAIERFERAGIARDVAPVSVNRIEIDEVGEQQTTVRERLHALDRAVEKTIVAVRLQYSSGSRMRENVVDLADCDDVAAGRGGRIENGRRRRRHGIIAAVSRARKPAIRVSDEGPRNDPADAQGIDEFARYCADSIETLQSEAFLVRSDLEDAVCRRVADGFARTHVLPAEFRDDFRSGGVFVAEDARQVGTPT